MSAAPPTRVLSAGCLGLGPAGDVYYHQVAKDDANSGPFRAPASPPPRVRSELEKFYLLFGLTGYF